MIELDDKQSFGRSWEIDLLIVNVLRRMRLTYKYTSFVRCEASFRIMVKFHFYLRPLWPKLRLEGVARVGNSLKLRYVVPVNIGKRFVYVQILAK